MKCKHLQFFLFLSVFFFGCDAKKSTLFSVVLPENSGVTFANTLPENDSINFLDYLYYYNGGGVAIGDINNDGLADIYFISNEGSNKLYLNQGNMKFTDITAKAGVEGKGNWKTGVTLADVNGDGLLDIYVSEVGGYKNLHGKNELFINNGNLTFSEKSEEFGLDIEGFNTQSTFFDYDHDGDLDVFIVNHSVHSTESFRSAAERKIKSEKSGDKLLRNDNGHFTEVTGEAGIYSSAIGYGLNVIAADLNNDGWDDLYVSNDFHENDYYYVNQQNGTFKEMNQAAFGHESRFSMGSDINDLNNDGWLDIVTLDMLPTDQKVLKSSAGDDPLEVYQYKKRFGYHDQYSRNCLQLNVNGGKNFSEIALYAGMAATDWSWSPLIADFNNDGVKDIFITNGIVKRPNDLDYEKFISAGNVQYSLAHGTAADKAVLDKMPDGKVSNYMFIGSTDLHFADETKNWGFGRKTYSNGSAYADLDNDGDLDIVINNINEPALIYQNNLNKRDTTNHNFLTVQLKGNLPNVFAFGSKVAVRVKDKLQVNNCTSTRGFESSSVQSLHFGLGKDSVVDEVEVWWPNGSSQQLKNVHANTTITFVQKNASGHSLTLFPVDENAGHLFTDITDSILLPFTHIENNYNDFNTQPFIPHQVSTQGPKLAVADVNNDGLDDVFVCGAAGKPGKLFIQKKQGEFISTNEKLFAKDSLCEDVNAVFFDANNDHFPDLIVVSGGNQFSGNNDALLDRVYLNDGKGNFYKSNTFPKIFENKSVAVPFDFDKDGDMDLFVGGRIIPGSYGVSPKSYLLINDGKGNFSIGKNEIAPKLERVGMVTDAASEDIDNDGWPDLVVAGEWTSIRIFKNLHGKFSDVTSKVMPGNFSGMWNCIKIADIDGDGDKDILAGNLGENSKLHASQQYPLKLFMGDFDKNGMQDQLLAVESNGYYYPFLGKEDLEKELPAMVRKRNQDYTSFSTQTVDDILKGSLGNVSHLEAATLSSSVFINDGKGNFSAKKLPLEAQWFPIYSFATADFNKDGITDIVCAGNFSGVVPYEGKYDAGYGLVLLGKGRSEFKPISPFASGLLINGEVRDSRIININQKKIIAFALNNAKPRFYSWK